MPRAPFTRMVPSKLKLELMRIYGPTTYAQSSLKTKLYPSEYPVCCLGALKGLRRLSVSADIRQSNRQKLLPAQKRVSFFLHSVRRREILGHHVSPITVCCHRMPAKDEKAGSSQTWASEGGLRTVDHSGNILKIYILVALVLLRKVFHFLAEEIPWSVVRS